MVTLYTRFIDEPALKFVTKQFEASADIPFLKPVWPMPDRPHSALLRTLEGHTDSVLCCAVDSQGKWVVSGAYDGRLRLWDVTAGSSMLVLRIDDWLSGCAWFPDGRRIVASGGKGLYVFEFKTGKPR